MTSTGSLPAGWRKVLAPDGRIYYQNDITKQTQWNEPTLNSSQNEPTSAPHAKAEQQTKDQTTIIYTVQAVVSPTKQTQPQQTQTMEITNQQKENMENNASIDDDDEYKSAGEKKIWHKDHIEWAFGVILTCYDYITDLSVVITWFSMNFTCKWPKYQCSLLSQQEEDTLSAMLPILAIILLIGSSIGFLVRIVWLKHEGKELYLVYKYPINKSDQDEKRLERYERALYLTWMPLILEDMLSVVLIWIVFSAGALQNVGNFGPVYEQSMVMSIINIVKALVLNLRKRIKLSKSAIHQETKKYRKAIMCHCCWCICSLGIMFTVMLLVFMLVVGRPVEPIYFLGNPNLLDLETEECHIFDEYEDDDYTQTEYLVEIPTRVSSSCYGINVDWSVSCSVPKDDDVEMDCSLIWIGDCVSLGSNGCKFTIDSGTCGKHIIECEEPLDYYYIGDSDWEEGDAVVFVCFDRCSL